MIFQPGLGPVSKKWFSVDPCFNIPAPLFFVEPKNECFSVEGMVSFTAYTSPINSPSKSIITGTVYIPRYFPSRGFSQHATRHTSHQFR